MTARWARALVSALAWTGCLSVAYAQQTSPLLHHAFEESEQGWTALGQNAKVSLTTEAASVKEGKSALRFDYAVTKGEFNLMLTQVPIGSLEKAKSFSFWVKSDYAAPLVLMVQEKEGGRYLALFTAPANRWQPVELSVSDFSLTEGADDPKDPNNRLDMDQVEGIALADLSQFFAQADAALVEAFGLKSGSHTLYLDDLKVNEAALPGSFSSVNGDVRFDTFARPQLSWMAVGGARLSVVSDKPLEGKALQVDYRSTAGKIVAVVKPIRRGSLMGTGKLTLSMASAKPTKIVIQVEERGGGKYNMVVDLPGDSEVKNLSFPFADFTAADDSRDTNGKLDLDQVYQVLFMDASGFLGIADQDNTLWINKLRASP
jgi:hypothetical protein